MKQTLFIAAFALLFPLASQAAKISPLIGAGIEFGGDKLVDVTYTDGSKSGIEAGRGLLLVGGVVVNLFETTPHTFETQASVGIKWTSTKEATNGSVDFFRWPIELLGFYRNTENNFRLGGGPVYQFGNELKGSKDAAIASSKFKNAVGLVIEGDYFVGSRKNMGLGLRFTSIKYQAETLPITVSANTLGFNFSYLW